jgi:hypothetical protein
MPDTSLLRAAAPDEIAASLFSALPYEGWKRVHHADDMMAPFTSDQPMTPFQRRRPSEPPMRRGAHRPPVKRQTESSRPGVVTLGQMAALHTAAGLTMIDVCYSRCERCGGLSIARLLADHGPELPGPKLRQIIAADRTRIIASKIPAVCGVHFPQLSKLAPITVLLKFIDLTGVYSAAASSRPVFGASGSELSTSSRTSVGRGRSGWKALAKHR